MNFVLDASVTLAWAFEDEGGEYAREVLARLERAGGLHHGPLAPGDLERTPGRRTTRPH